MDRQDTLFELPPPSPPPGIFRPEMYPPGSRRPSRYDEVVVNTAARELAEALIHQHPDGFKVDELDEYAAALAEEIDTHEDGFELAKRLEGKGWICDAEMVETLNGADQCLDDAHDEAIQAWVIGAGIQPEFAVGDRVLVEGLHVTNSIFPRRYFQTFYPTFELTIREVKTKTGQYTAYSLALGHLSDEQMAENERSIHDRTAKFVSGSHGYILDYERVRRPYCYGCGWPNPGGICQPPPPVRVGGILSEPYVAPDPKRGWD